MKSALILGCNGQDGKIISDQLRQDHYRLLGLDIGTSKADGFTWDQPVDIQNSTAIQNVIRSFRPDEVYFLAAFHQSSEDAPLDNLTLFQSSYQINVLALNNVLEGIRLLAPQTRLFYAASSLIFGSTDTDIQDENTPFNPDSIYGITKLAGLQICRYYRKHYSLFAASGILYNHESIYRSDRFLSMKIIKGALNIKNGKQDKLVLGDLHAEVDWGYAPDYTKAMRLILGLSQPADYIIATGKKYSVLDFVKITFDCLGLNWQDYVIEDKKVITRTIRPLVGNPKKLVAAAGWKPTVDFVQMIKQLLKEQEALNR